MKRLQEVHDQIISNIGVVKPLVVVRFNPIPKVEKPLKATLEEVFTKEILLGDARGVVLHKVLGYGKKRKEQYESSEITKRIKI